MIFNLSKKYVFFCLVKWTLSNMHISILFVKVDRIWYVAFKLLVLFFLAFFVFFGLDFVGFCFMYISNKI